jgi:hypothetical protein
MSPEQFRSEPLDGRSDLFSLAVILYQALCGERPFAGDDLASLAFAVTQETPVPVSRRAEGLPSGLDAFFEKALAKSPDDRFPDGGAFRRALAEARRRAASEPLTLTLVDAGLPSTAPSPSPGKGPSWATPGGPPTAGGERRPEREGVWRRRALLAAAVAVLALVVSLGGRLFAGGGGERSGSGGVGGARTAGSYLMLEVRSKVEMGEFRLLLDDEAVYSRALAASRIGPKVFGKKPIRRFKNETFDARIELEPGRHRLVALVTPDGNGKSYERNALVDVEPGEFIEVKVEIGTDVQKKFSLRLD